MGLEVEQLRGREARAAANPAWRPGCGPGCWRRASARSTRRRSVDALLAAATAAGVRLVRATVDHLVTDAGAGHAGSRVTGVAVRGASAPPTATVRRIGARTVVLAAGCRSGTLAGDARPRPPAGAPDQGPDPHAAPARRRPAGHADACGASCRGRASTWCPATTAGWWSAPRSRSGAGTRCPPPAGPTSCCATRWPWSPGLDDAELVAVRAGLRPGSPDDLPMIGPSGGRRPGRRHGAPPQRHPARPGHRRGGGRRRGRRAGARRGGGVRSPPLRHGGGGRGHRGGRGRRRGHRWDRPQARRSEARR